MHEWKFISLKKILDEISFIHHEVVGQFTFAIVNRFQNLHESFEEEGRGFLRIDCTFWNVAINTNYFFSVFDMSGFLFSKSSRPRINQIVVPLACMRNGLSNWQSRAHSFATFPNTASCSHLSYDIKHTNKTHGTDKP